MAGPEPVPIFSAASLQPTERSRREAVAGPHRGAPPIQAPAGRAAPVAAAPFIFRRAPAPSGLSMGQFPTQPPAPVQPGPPAPAPMPPPTPQVPGTGLQPAPAAPRQAPPGPPLGRPRGPRAKVPPAQARRFRELADGSLVVVRRAVAVPAAASARDRWVARAVQACVRDLAADVGPLGQIVSELRDAERDNRDADLDLEQVKALEKFAACAIDAMERAKSQATADVVGSGIPAAAAVGLLLL